MNDTTNPTPKILAVDDNPDNLGVLLELLTAQGYRLLVAEDGSSALQQAEYVRPDLILLDILLPDMDGFAVCSALKERAATRDIPVLFMSALTDTQDKVRGLELGAVDYITKPFQHDEVLARVRTHLALETLRRRLGESEARLANVLESTMDAILTWDEAGRVRLFNRAAERVLKCSTANAIGQPLESFLTDSLRRLLEDYRAQGGDDAAPLWLPQGLTAKRADGEEFPIEASLSRCWVETERLHTLILRDVQERSRAEAEQRRLQGLTRYLQEQLDSVQGPTDLIGAEGGLRAVMDRLRQVATTDATVLITGETGTGKEVIARAVHAMSARSDEALVTLNCAAIPAGLVESELFGHEKGAFTGALARKIGRFELANGGTLFLDELGELPIDLQAKLLRVLQEREIERVGNPRSIKVDVRIIAATNRNLQQRVADDEFRSDLFYRLNVFPIALPALRERREDIPALAAHFVQHYSAKYGRRISVIPKPVEARLVRLDWPGNVRELQHLIERAVIMSPGVELVMDEPLETAPGAPKTDSTALRDVERDHILRVLKATHWRISGPNGAAERLGLKPTTLESRLKRLGITRPGA
ncbi:MAG: sigma 54-interacting transcriptional regulator [Thiohalocapsa sp.]